LFIVRVRAVLFVRACVLVFNLLPGGFMAVKDSPVQNERERLCSEALNRAVALVERLKRELREAQATERRLRAELGNLQQQGSLAS